jgi:hypothetical protein
MSLNGIFLRWFAERGAKDKTYQELIQLLQENESTTLARLLNASDMGVNRKRAAHVIGIERWSAHRMRTLLGEPLVMDEYDGYAPSAELNMERLAGEFKVTRASTIALVRELEAKGIALSQTAKHNELGDLSAGGWIVYVSSHTGRETIALIPTLHHKTDKAVQS